MKVLLKRKIYILGQPSWLSTLSLLFRLLFSLYYQQYFCRIPINKLIKEKPRK
jgi:hypothetical protein